MLTCLFINGFFIFALVSLLNTRQERLGKGGGLDGQDQFIFEHVAPACGNLCRALGEDFAMFLPVVLPPLLAALEAKVKFSMEAADPDEDGEVRHNTANVAQVVGGAMAVRVFRFPLVIAMCTRGPEAKSRFLQCAVRRRSRWSKVKMCPDV